MNGTVFSFIFSTIFFAVCWGLIMWFRQWKKAGVRVPRAISLSLFSGVLYAVLQSLVQNML
ncbi:MULTISPECIES: DUF6404 family protein [Tatumella]|uniref:DUF6404 family protein n=1 Tax=Tatumella punctata TaxID=399969 RepID=A0ABW1VLH7_9GAMM